MVFLIYINMLLVLNSFEDSFLDVDLLNQLYAVFIPILFGISFFVLFRFISLVIPNFKMKLPYKITITVSVVIVIIFYLSKNPLSKVPFHQDKIKEQIIQAYDQLDSNLLPYSYAVSNTYQNVAISRNSHYFISRII